MYTEVQGDTLEEYQVKLLAYAGERMDKVAHTFGRHSAEYQLALGRWSGIYRLQVKAWPDDSDLAQLNSLIHT